MSGTLTLFEQTEVPATSGSGPFLELPLAHPYSRYGLAVALYMASELSVDLKENPEKLDEATLRECLAFALESGLGKFRMQTFDDPQLERLLTFHPIPSETLQAQPTLVQSAGLAARGIYIYPTVVTTDGDAKGTFENVTAIIKALKGGDASHSSRKYSRSFAPTTAKSNNGTASQSEPKGTLIETACAAITTLTPLKPAAWAERNTVIIPDLSVAELLRFIQVFDKMSGQEIEKPLDQIQLPPLETKPVSTKGKAAKVDAKPKSEYRRPRMHNGNYPFAPRDANAFGAVGLLAAIGRWASSSEYFDLARAALESLSSAPLYIISYDKISQARFNDHVVKLAIEARLSEMLEALWREVKLYSDIDSPRINHQAPAYQLFYFQTNRFLQSFSLPAFRDFLAARAEYPPELGPLFQEFFLTQMMKLELEARQEIVKSAGELGQWLNRTAFHTADGEYETGASDRQNKVRKAKAKILVEFESAAMSAKSPEDLLFRISTRAGRLLQDDAPAGAKRFMDAVASGEIEQQEAVHLLIAYMRLRAPRKETGEPARVTEPETEAKAVVPEPIED